MFTFISGSDKVKVIFITHEIEALQSVMTSEKERIIHIFIYTDKDINENNSIYKRESSLIPTYI